MNKISKEVKIGIAFIIAIFVLYYGISFLKGIDIFKSSNSYIVVFDNVGGVTKSAPVTLNGYQVGLVSAMSLDPNNPKQVVVTVDMNKDVKITQGSKVDIDVSMLGNSSIILDMNPHTKELYASTDTIVGTRSKGLMDAAGSMLPKVEALLPKLDSILSGIQTLVNNPALSQSLTNVDEITSNLAKTSGQLNVMVNTLGKDVPAITGNFKNISADLSNVTTQLKSVDVASAYNSIDSTLKNVQQLSTKIAAKDNSLGLLLNDRELYDSINSTIGNASLLLKDVKENPQRYINIKVF